MTCPKDIFQQVQTPCAGEVFNFVPLFQKLGITEDHPGNKYMLIDNSHIFKPSFLVNGVLEDIQKYMDIYLSKSSKN